MLLLWQCWECKLPPFIIEGALSLTYSTCCATWSLSINVSYDSVVHVQCSVVFWWLQLLDGLFPLCLEVLLPFPDTCVVNDVLTKFAFYFSFLFFDLNGLLSDVAHALEEVIWYFLLCFVSTICVGVSSMDGFIEFIRFTTSIVFKSVDLYLMTLNNMCCLLNFVKSNFLLLSHWWYFLFHLLRFRFLFRLFLIRHWNFVINTHRFLRWTYLITCSQLHLLLINLHLKKFEIYLLMIYNLLFRSLNFVVFFDIYRLVFSFWFWFFSSAEA